MPPPAMTSGRFASAIRRAASAIIDGSASGRIRAGNAPSGVRRPDGPGASSVQQVGRQQQHRRSGSAAGRRRERHVDVVCGARGLRDAPHPLGAGLEQTQVLELLERVAVGVRPVDVLRQRCRRSAPRSTSAPRPAPALDSAAAAGPFCAVKTVTRWPARTKPSAMASLAVLQGARRGVAGCQRPPAAKQQPRVGRLCGEHAADAVAQQCLRDHCV